MVYAQAGMETKRPQHRAVDMLFDRKPKNSSMERAETERAGCSRKTANAPEVAV